MSPLFKDWKKEPSAETPYKGPLPQVAFVEKKSDELKNYHINVDTQKLANLLVEFGVDENIIANLKIKISLNPSLAIGQYDKRKNTLTIWGKNIAHQYDSLLKNVTDFVSGQTPELDLDGLQSGAKERLVDYLTNSEISKRRRIEFAEYIIRNSVNRFLNEQGAFHEAGHLIDDYGNPEYTKKLDKYNQKINKLDAATLGTAMGVILSNIDQLKEPLELTAAVGVALSALLTSYIISYKIGYDEKSARDFAEKMSHWSRSDWQWLGIDRQ